MTSVILYLLLKDQAIDAVLARFAPAMKTMPSFEVQIVLHNKRGNVKADLVLDGKKRLFYHADAGSGYDYTLAISPAGYREVEGKGKSYDEYPYPGELHLYTSRISPLSATLPAWLGVGDLHRLIPANAKLASEGTEEVNGILCDKISAKFSDKMGKMSLEFSIAKSGLVYRYHSVMDSMQGHTDDTWTFSGYRPLSSISASRFETRIPDGYMPFSVPDRNIPVEIDKKPDLNGWVDSKSGKPWNPAAGKPVLFVLTGTDSLPSKRAIVALNSWRSALRAKGVEVAIASNEPTRAAANGLLYDPSQKSVHALDFPASPMFALVDSTGKLRNLWMGFVPSEAGKLKADLLNAVSALK